MAEQSYVAVGHRLPAFVANPLFGDRERYGRVPIEDDPTWQEWLSRNIEFYNANQRASVGSRVNNAGHRVVRGIPLDGKRVLEIGPGALDHTRYWSGQPDFFTCVDIDRSFLDLALTKLTDLGTPHTHVLTSREGDPHIPVEDASQDVVFTFYALEHVQELHAHLDEIARILRPGGLLVGAIPCEGGLAWGLGRYLTSRVWLKKNTNIDPNKLICWEHPNFADQILNAVTGRFETREMGFWPLRVPVIDINLIARFVVRRP